MFKLVGNFQRKESSARRSYKDLKNIRAMT
jgi:hypothetical protein